METRDPPRNEGLSDSLGETSLYVPPGSAVLVAPRQNTPRFGAEHLTGDDSLDDQGSPDDGEQSTSQGRAHKLQGIVEMLSQSKKCQQSLPNWTHIWAQALERIGSHSIRWPN